MIDRQRTQQILINLLQNAIKFSEPKGKITIEATREQEPAEAPNAWNYMIKVTDHGIGVNYDDQVNLFQPNFVS